MRLRLLQLMKMLRRLSVMLEPVTAERLNSARYGTEVGHRIVPGRQLLMRRDGIERRHAGHCRRLMTVDGPAGARLVRRRQVLGASVNGPV